MTREQYISVVESTQRELRRFLVALCCGDSQLADDIAQETLIKAFIARDSLADTSKARSWIFSIAHNTFISQKRALKPTTDVEEAYSLASPEAGDDAFKYQALYAALDKLPPKERTSTLLFYLEGYAIKEIAAIVGASDDAVRQHLARARQHLRAILSPSIA